jgi:HlyD family secretion protein
MKTGKRQRLVIGLGVVGLLLAGGAWLIAKALSRPKPIPAEKIVPIERADIARSVVAVGQVEPLSKVEVKSKANGIIQALRVDVGDDVTEGQVLAELDKENLQAQLREAKATLDGEKANLQVATSAEAKARIEAANPELEFARRDLERIQSLFEQKVASQQALDDAQESYEVAQNRRQLLQAAAESAAAMVLQAQARMAAAQAALDRADENLRYASIRSPIRGVVLARPTELGDAVSSILNLGSAATLIMTLGDMSSVYVKGEVDEADVGKIRVGLPVRTTVESFPGESFAGTVTRIAPIGKEVNNVTTFEVRVSIANPEGRLRVNMSANAEIVLEEHQGVLIIPEAALVYDRGTNTSVQLRDERAPVGFRKVAVRTGISNGQRTEVLEGVAETDHVVLP